jgi:hypothetical protein
VLLGAVEVSEALHKGEAVLLHCSDGWDRTSQLASIAQILLDPYYRTFKGYAGIMMMMMVVVVVIEGEYESIAQIPLDPYYRTFNGYGSITWCCIPRTIASVALSHVWMHHVSQHNQARLIHKPEPT